MGENNKSIILDQKLDISLVIVKDKECQKELAFLIKKKIIFLDEDCLTYREEEFIDDKIEVFSSESF